MIQIYIDYSKKNNINNLNHKNNPFIKDSKIFENQKKIKCRFLYRTKEKKKLIKEKQIWMKIIYKF